MTPLEIQIQSYLEIERRRCDEAWGLVDKWSDRALFWQKVSLGWLCLFFICVFSFLWYAIKCQVTS